MWLSVNSLKIRSRNKKEEYKPTEIITPPPTVEPKPAPAPVEPVKEIETDGGPDYNDNPDPRLFAYNLFGELEPIGKPQRQPKHPTQQEDKPKPTVTVTDTQAKKFRPLSEKELEFYGSLDWM